MKCTPSARLEQEFEGTTSRAATEGSVAHALATLSWVAVGIETFVNDRKHEKREEERSKNDAEYHLKHMEEFKKVIISPLGRRHIPAALVVYVKGLT